MAILDIKAYPESVLTQVAKPIRQIDDTVRQLLDHMAETMYEASGVGLAAPQVGKSLRAIVVDASPRVEGEKLIKLINPVITFSEGSTVCEEGCLSVPGFSENVTRPAKVVVEGYDENEKPVKIETDTFLATVLQHEIDHLNGVLFIDHLGRLKRDMIRRKLRKQARQHKKQQVKDKVRL
jgi:peptide deformylase